MYRSEKSKKLFNEKFKIRLKCPDKIWDKFLATCPRTEAINVVIVEMIEKRIKNFGGNLNGK